MLTVDKVRKFEQEHILGDDEDGLDELFEELENDDEDEFLAGYREQRMQEIADRIKAVDKNVKHKSYGVVESIDEESQLMKLVTQTERIIVHFTMDSFRKCQVMSMKLKILAQCHLQVKFVEIEPGKCPFLVEKLQIRALPLLIGYNHKGRECLKVVGFTKLIENPTSGVDDFDIYNLETQLQRAGLIEEPLAHTIEVRPNHAQRSDSESDLDI